MVAKQESQDYLDELINKIDNGKFADYLADSDAAEEIVCWIQDEVGIKSKTLIRFFVKQVIKVIMTKGRIIAEKKASQLSVRAYNFLKGIKGSQTIARGMITVMNKVIEKQLDQQLLKDIIAGKRPARDVLEAETLSKEFSAQYSKLLEVEDLTKELRTLILEQQNPQPDLVLPLFPVTKATRMHFASRSIPFLGRGFEFNELMAFLKDERQFSWWLLMGVGGLGKSRLALEFCLRFGNAWRMGFLPNISRHFDWSSWQPEEPTLIVVDYASLRGEEVREILLSLWFRSDSLNLPVRVLLIERTLEKGQLNRLFGITRATQEYHAIELSQFNEPLELAAMDSNGLLELMCNISPKLANQSQSNKNEVIAKLTEIDPLKRPLFAAISADAIESGRDLRSWDREQLLQDLLGRERQKLWANAGVDERDENLLALATMMQGAELNIVRNPPKGINLPTPQKALKDRYESMCGRRLDKVFHPLEPDIVGEFFVLEHLKGDELFGLSNLPDYWYAAYRGQGDKFLTFLRRTMQDFETHPVTIDLMNQCYEHIRGHLENIIPQRMESDPSLRERINGTYEFEITGSFGGTWFVDVRHPHGNTRKEGEEADCKITIGDWDFLAMLNRQLNLQNAFMQGKLRIRGKMSLALQLVSLLW